MAPPLATADGIDARSPHRPYSHCWSAKIPLALRRGEGLGTRELTPEQREVSFRLGQVLPPRLAASRPPLLLRHHSESTEFSARRSTALGRRSTCSVPSMGHVYPGWAGSFVPSVVTHHELSTRAPQVSGQHGQLSVDRSASDEVEFVAFEINDCGPSIVVPAQPPNPHVAQGSEAVRSTNAGHTSHPGAAVCQQWWSSVSDSPVRSLGHRVEARPAGVAGCAGDEERGRSSRPGVGLHGHGRAPASGCCHKGSGAARGDFAERVNSR